MHTSQFNTTRTTADEICRATTAEELDVIESRLEANTAWDAAEVERHMSLIRARRETLAGFSAPVQLGVLQAVADAAALEQAGFSARGASTTEAEIRDFIRTWQPLAGRYRLHKGWSCFMDRGCKATVFGLEWRVKSGKRQIRAIKTRGVLYVLRHSDIEQTTPWRSMADKDCWSALYADFAGLLEA